MIKLILNQCDTKIITDIATKELADAETTNIMIHDVPPLPFSFTHFRIPILCFSLNPYSFLCLSLQPDTKNHQKATNKQKEINNNNKKQAPAAITTTSPEAKSKSKNKCLWTFCT